MMYRHGLRVTEAIKLRLDAINLKQSSLWVKRIKNSLSTQQPITGDELRAIKRYLATFRVRTGEGAWEEVRETIGYLMTATPFGQSRRWFQCPGCARRCRILYGGKRFRCRQCQGLRYECQYEPTTQRASRQQRKVRRRLGGSTNLMEEFPPRPSGMHRTTYQALEELDDDMQSIWVRSVFELVGRSRS